MWVGMIIVKTVLQIVRVGALAWPFDALAAFIIKILGQIRQKKKASMIALMK